MDKARADFAVATNNGVIKQVGRSSILQPKTCFKGGTVKFFDDNKLLKKNVKEISLKEDK